MFWRVTKVILILPGTALVYVPLLLQWLSGGWPFAPLNSGPLSWVLAAIIAAPALALAITTIRLFRSEGKGTPAPWDPPVEFVVSGPYRHMRNPMISAILALILAEALALGSWALLGWAVFFFLLNSVYFILSEEPGLERRFGETFRHYKAAVPRWIPKASPYHAPKRD